MDQTTGEDYMQFAKDLAKAEKELSITQWVNISIERMHNNEHIKLYNYQIPRSMLDRWEWVIRWRRSKYQCMYPKDNVSSYMSFFDKKTGLDYGIGSFLGTITSAKAQITKYERLINNYILSKKDDLFFNENSGPNLLKAKATLQTKMDHLDILMDKLKEKIIELKNG